MSNTKKKPVVSTAVNTLELLGVDPSSPHAGLLANIYNITKPSSEFMKNYKSSDLKENRGHQRSLERVKSQNNSKPSENLSRKRFSSPPSSEREKRKRKC